MRSNADYGLTLQKRICDKYNIPINDWAKKQFNDVYNASYEENIDEIIPIIFEEVRSTPKKLLTYVEDVINGRRRTSPHNFELQNGKTLSIRTTKTSDKICPKVVGQAGFPVLNDFFSETYGALIETQYDIQKLMVDHIHEVLPVFIDYLFQSDFTVIINRMSKDDMQVIKADEIGDYSFTRDEFEFTRGLGEWTESTTLKYHNISIAELQTHKNRTFKFRFAISKIPVWFKQIKINNETLGISAEAAICEYFDLKMPNSFKTRASKLMERKLLPAIKNAFKEMPSPVEHTGSEPGERGEQSKCSYDFILEGGLTMSLKTNKGNKVCPPEVGQPGSETCLHYFKEFFDEGTSEVTNDSFKRMVFEHIDEIMPIYVDHMFDSDWLLWLHDSKDGYVYESINRNDIKKFKWYREKFSFTKSNIEEWNESNTVKYEGNTIGEFQVHSNRNCYKFRFKFDSLLELLRKK